MTAMFQLNKPLFANSNFKEYGDAQSRMHSRAVKNILLILAVTAPLILFISILAYSALLEGNYKIVVLSFVAICSFLPIITFSAMQILYSYYYHAFDVKLYDNWLVVPSPSIRSVITGEELYISTSAIEQIGIAIDSVHKNDYFIVTNKVTSLNNRIIIWIDNTIIHRHDQFESQLTKLNLKVDERDTSKMSHVWIGDIPFKKLRHLKGYFHLDS